MSTAVFNSPQDTEPEGFAFPPLLVSVTPLVGTDEYEDYLFSQGVYPADDYVQVCECEIDWACGLHRPALVGGPSAIDDRVRQHVLAELAVV